jgi:hypothetical protein
MSHVILCSLDEVSCLTAHLPLTLSGFKPCEAPNDDRLLATVAEQLLLL